MYEPILMMVKDAKNYTFNGDAILVEAKTGSQRVDQLSQKSSTALQSSKSTG